MPLKSPFESSIAKPGQGKVVLSLLPPSSPTLTTLTYKYPLKLLTRSPDFVPESSVLKHASRPVHLYLLSYGGGLLPGDIIDVSIKLEQGTRLVVTTPQGSTKIFKTEPTSASRGGNLRSVSDMSRQMLDVQIGRDAALCYLPDPSVPFRDSRYEQAQTFTVDRGGGNNDSSNEDGKTSSEGGGGGGGRSSLCILDWVTQGRTSRGENWDFHLWKGKNEVWTTSNGKRKLLLRDSLILDDEIESEEDENENENDTNKKQQQQQQQQQTSSLIRQRTTPHGVVGTLILYGPIFEPLSSFIMDRFTSQPRIGARNWSSSSSSSSIGTTSAKQDVTWTAARVRAGFVLMKFGAKDFETAKEWLGGLFREEGSVIKEFGEEALMCL